MRYRLRSSDSLSQGGEKRMPSPSAPARFKQNTEGQFVCPECGNTYSRERAVRRHMTAKHGWEPAKKTVAKKAQIARREEVRQPLTSEDAPAKDTVSFQVRSELRELALPLQEKLATLDRRLVALNREAQDIRDARNQIERTLRGLIGTQQQASTRGVNLSETLYRKKFVAVQDYLKRLPPELQEGFTANALAESMKTDGVTPALSGQTAAKVIQELHEQGVLRLDKISQGGGKSFLLAGRNGNREE
jgi:carbamoylphosphate synthase large subunit